MSSIVEGFITEGPVRSGTQFHTKSSEFAVLHAGETLPLLREPVTRAKSLQAAASCPGSALPSRSRVFH